MYLPKYHSTNGWEPNPNVGFGDLRKEIEISIQSRARKSLVIDPLLKLLGALRYVSCNEGGNSFVELIKEESVSESKLIQQAEKRMLPNAKIKGGLKLAQKKIQDTKSDLEELGYDPMKFKLNRRDMIKVRERTFERISNKIFKGITDEFDVSATGMVTKLNWHILHADSWCELKENVSGLLKENVSGLRRRNNDEYELERLKVLYDKEPDRIYIGLGEFEGYVVFEYEKADVVFLECVKKGNALYVMPKLKWKEYSTYSKTELLQSHMTSRVIHGRNWRFSIEMTLSVNGII
jgi:hypothetical protein